MTKIPNPSGPQKPERDYRQQETPQDAEGPLEASGVDDFLQRLPGSFHWPKPNAEAIAAAVEAVHRLSGNAAQDLAAAAEPDHSADACPACGRALPPGARFCLACGLPTHPGAGDAGTPARPTAAQHHYHHHYHHFVPDPASPGRAASSSPVAESDSSTPRGRAPGSSASASGGRAEVSARQVVQDWAQACNTRHIDDLLELYAPDATLIRSSVPPVRSLPAIREFLISLLEAGLGDVEMESLRLDIMGEIALDLGRCKMLVPVAMGKRREERGKYLVVLVRQPAGTWKIFADCWSSDLAVSAAPDPPRKPGETPPPQRKPR